MLTQTSFSSITRSELPYLLLVFLIVLSPLIVNAILGALLPGAASQKALTLSAMVFALFALGWFIWASIINSNPQSPIAILWTGIYSLPLMLPLWLTAFVRRHKDKQAGS
jgi:Na+/proline symporter